MNSSAIVLLLLLFYSDRLIEKFLNSTEEDTRILDELINGQ